jgi:ectoine hydroxylase-related dioxygenase (phytanoyl-CoA dioxygenase family)
MIVARLSKEEVHRYDERGYLIPSYSLPAEQLARLRGTLDRLIRDNPDVRPEKLVSAHIEGDNGEGVRGSGEFLELARDPQIVEIVSQVIGEDVILWGCQVFCKPGGDGFETPWHQDGHYWPIRPLANCTVWVALDDSTPENGCLRVIPGSHRDKRIHPHLLEDRDDIVLSQRTADDVFDPEQAADVVLRAGQMSMHDVFMIHGANPNRSPKRRAGIAIRYMPGTSVFERDLNPAGGRSGIPVLFAKRPLWLLRGQDRTGRNDFSVGHRG